MQYGGEDHQQLNRTLAGFARHANIGAYLIVGLGCETGQASFLADSEHLVQIDVPGREEGGAAADPQHAGRGGHPKDGRAGRRDARRRCCPKSNKVRREPIPVSELILGTNCGGSDGNSGVTANPALGFASDLLVAHGGTSVLAETTEIYGGEHTLTRRAVTRAVGEKLIERIKWWEQYTSMFGTQINNNPSVGNKKGGLTTIYEKSLGAIAKGGTTALREVYKFAEPIRSKGFVIMDTPGYDPVSVTGLVAGGCNVVVFTTGRGSCFGCKPVAVDQGRHQHADVRTHGRRHGHQRRRDSGRDAGRRSRARDLREDHRRRQRRKDQERGPGRRRRRVRPVGIGPTL